MFFDVVEKGTSSVAGGENFVSDGSRREDVHAPEGFYGGAPDRFAIGWENASEEAAGLDKDLIDALNFISGWIF